MEQRNVDPTVTINTPASLGHSSHDIVSDIIEQSNIAPVAADATDFSTSLSDSLKSSEKSDRSTDDLPSLSHSSDEIVPDTMEQRNIDPTVATNTPASLGHSLKSSEKSDQSTDDLPSLSHGSHDIVPDTMEQRNIDPTVATNTPASLGHRSFASNDDRTCLPVSLDQEAEGVNSSSSPLHPERTEEIQSQSRFITVVTTGLLAIFGGLTIGYALSVTGGIIGVQRFLIKFSKGLHKRGVKATTNTFCAFTDIRLLFFVEVIPLAALLSIWISYKLARSWGCKPVLICGSVLVILGSLLTGWFPDVIFEFIGLAITGCAVGFLYQVIPVICQETDTGYAQNYISFSFYYMLICGSTLAKAVNLAASGNHINGWRWSFWACGILASPIFLLSVLLNETPQFLIKQGRLEEAKVALRRIRKHGAEAELQNLSHLIDNEEREPWKKLLHSPVLVINVVAQIFQRVLSLDSILFFGPLFLQSIGYTYHAAYLASFLAGAIRMGVAGFTYFSYSFFGRRRTLLFSSAGILLSEISLFGVFHGASLVFSLTQQTSYMAITSTILLIGCYSLLSGPRDWTEAAYPDDLRALGACCETTVFLFMTLVMNIVTLPLICALKAWIFVLLAIISLCVGFIIYKFLPEIGKKEGELPEAAIWKLHWFWKRLLPKEDSAVGV